MRISDWSSDVCSSDLILVGAAATAGLGGGFVERDLPAGLGKAQRGRKPGEAGTDDMGAPGDAARREGVSHGLEPVPQRYPQFLHLGQTDVVAGVLPAELDRKSTRLNSSH